MVTKVQLDRLNSRIAALAVHQAPHRIGVIYVDVGESEEAAKERHYLARPEDREASRTIIVRYVDPKAGRPVEEAPP
jgi:hypothetical protein